MGEKDGKNWAIEMTPTSVKLMTDRDGEGEILMCGRIPIEEDHFSTLNFQCQMVKEGSEKCSRRIDEAVKAAFTLSYCE